MIVFTCPHCEERVRYSDNLGGLRLKCRSCFVPVDVPAAQTEVVGPASRRSSGEMTGGTPVPPDLAQDSDPDLPSSLFDTDVAEDKTPPQTLRGLAEEIGEAVEPLPALLEVAGPDLYRGNPFRVAGLGAEATPR